MEFKKKIQIAIDGPVASGKSTGAFLLAKKLGILYIYTGAMYRAVAWLAVKNNFDFKNEDAINDLLKKTKLQLKKPSKKNHFCDVIINGADITNQLFNSEISWGSSAVAVLPKIRKYLVKLQQKMAEDQSVVMEGRDIGSVVLPKADLKIFLTADLSVRAKRRFQQMKNGGEKVIYSEVLAELKKRDFQDSERSVDPLHPVDGAWILDTTSLTIGEEVELIIKKLIKNKLISK